MNYQIQKNKKIILRNFLLGLSFLMLIPLSTNALSVPSVDLLWVANTYTPPFYKGKALPGSNSTVKIVAMPNVFNSNGVKIKSSSLVYEWRFADRFFQQNSGLAKDTFLMEGPRTNSSKFMRVEVSSFAEESKVAGTVSITTKAPEIIFYENHPLLGIRSDKALSEEFNLEETEVVIRGEPFFFSVDDIIDYQWFINNRKVEVDSNKWNDITLRQGEGVSGSSRIGFSLSSIGRVLQFADDSFVINFGSEGGGIFGF